MRLWSTLRSLNKLILIQRHLINSLYHAKSRLIAKYLTYQPTTSYQRVSAIWDWAAPKISADSHVILRKKCKLTTTSPTIRKKLAGGIYVESVCNLKSYCGGKVCSALLELAFFNEPQDYKSSVWVKLLSEWWTQTVGRSASGLMRLLSGRSESGVGCSNQITPSKPAVISVICRRAGECVRIGLGLEVVLH